MTDLLDRIDEVTTATCAQCRGPLGNSVSDDFCTPDCQRRWTERHYGVAALEDYREAYYAYDYGFAADTARWTPQVEVIVDGREWSLAVADARAWLDCAREQAAAIPLPDGVGFTHPGPVGVQVEVTDDPAADAMVAAVAAARTPDPDDAARLREFARERTRETRTVRLLDQDNDPAAHALQARRRRNTGPAVHADPRRNQRRPR